MSKNPETRDAARVADDGGNVAAPRRKTKASDTSFLDDLVAETPELLARLDAPRPNDAPVPHLPISDIAPDPRQPRRHIDAGKLAELAADIEKTGILQPLVVRPAPDWNGYVLVFGERRYRAALKAGLKHVPAFVRRDLTDADVLQLQWQENAQREDIDDIDKALHLKRMKEVQKLSWTQLAEAVHLTRRHLLRMQRLADMPDAVTSLVRERRLTPSHVYQIARVDDPARQAALATEAAESGWSV
ncbi:MAG: ParB/RepB/Spo0J family partition protein, partial [Armatimonadota bacterium]